MSRYAFGPRLTEEGVTFRLWASVAKRIDAMLNKLHPLMRDRDGGFSTEVKGVKAGARYRFHIDGGANAYWQMDDGKILRLIANLPDSEKNCELRSAHGVAIWGGDATRLFAPWSLHVHLGDK
jgi:hypothetical protein